jgi:hypothetical protein
LKWGTSESLTNTPAYNHKILNYNPKIYYYAGVVCSLCFKFKVWAFKIMNKWNTDKHASLQSQNYCDQPFITETMRCSSNDFIEINDNSGQNAVHFYVWRIRRGRELTTGETEKERLWERELIREGDSMGTKIRTFS